MGRFSCRKMFVRKLLLFFSFSHNNSIHESARIGRIFGDAQLKNLSTMPIKDWSKYPPNWKTVIRPRILARAKNRCELCGAKNYAYGHRAKNGEWFDSRRCEGVLEGCGVDLFDSEQPLGHCFDKVGNPTRPTRIVLTIAHWHNPDPMDCRDANLKAACQYCHNNHDSPQRVTNARFTREAKAGLQRLF